MVVIINRDMPTPKKPTPGQLGETSSGLVLRSKTPTRVRKPIEPTARKRKQELPVLSRLRQGFSPSKEPGPILTESSRPSKQAKTKGQLSRLTPELISSTPGVSSEPSPCFKVDETGKPTFFGGMDRQELASHVKRLNASLMRIGSHLLLNGGTDMMVKLMSSLTIIDETYARLLSYSDFWTDTPCLWNIREELRKCWQETLLSQHRVIREILGREELLKTLHSSREELKKFVDLETSP